MPRIRSLAQEHPLRFSFAISLVFILLVLISSIVTGRMAAAETLSWYIASMISRLISTSILLTLLWRLGWLDPTGFTKLGGWQTWLILLILLQYAMMVSAYIMTGSVSFGYSDAVLTGTAILFIMLHAFLEEVTFRGLVMHGLVRAWGGSNRSFLRSVLGSSWFYAGYHILYIAGEPLTIVLGRMLVAFLLGILFGALVLRSGSIYPAAYFHAMLNVAGYLNITSTAVEGTTSSWLLLSLFMLPLALYGLYLLRGLAAAFTSSTRLIKSHERV